MSFQPNERQTLYLWSLLASGGEGYAREQAFKLGKAAERKDLVQAGLIDEKRQKFGAIYNTLNENGWAWVSEHLNAKLPHRSGSGVQVLQTLIARLGAYLQASGTSLAEIIVPAGSNTDADMSNDSTLHSNIRQAYQQLSNGEWNVRVRLADLRSALPTVVRDVLDQALLQMQREALLALYMIDDPTDITPADEQAAIDILGAKRHIIYMGA